MFINVCPGGDILRAVTGLIRLLVCSRKPVENKLSGRLFKWNKVSLRISFDLSNFVRYKYLQINYACTVGLLNPQIHRSYDCPDEHLPSLPILPLLSRCSTIFGNLKKSFLEKTQQYIV